MQTVFVLTQEVNRVLYALTKNDTWIAFDVAMRTKGYKDFPTREKAHSASLILQDRQIEIKEVRP